MKSYTQEISDNRFKPFKLVLEVESVEELEELWHRFNLSLAVLKGLQTYEKGKHLKGKYLNKPALDGNVWNLLDKKFIQGK